MDGNKNEVVTDGVAGAAGVADGMTTTDSKTTKTTTATTDASLEHIREFKELALFLARSYGQMLRDRDCLKSAIDAGIPQYTREMAIRDLSSISVNYESERVQTSNISRIPERIAELLDSGYVEKMNRRLQREMLETVNDHTYLCWKIEVVETAMRERMDKMEQAIFTRIFVRGLTFAQLKKAYRKRLHNAQICKHKEAAISAVADELALASRSKMTMPGYVSRLRSEAAKAEAEAAEEARKAR